MTEVVFLPYDAPLSSEDRNFLKGGQPKDYLQRIQGLLREDQDRSLIGRGALRLFLARLSEKPLQEIVICQETGKKPWCPSLRTFDFNLSHCKSGVAIAVSHAKVGIDLEEIDLYDASLIDYVLGPSEQAWFHKLSPNEKVMAFYHLWTCKEAFLKYLGVGFSIDPREVTFDQDYDLMGKEEVKFTHFYPQTGLIQTVCSKEGIKGNQAMTINELMTGLRNQG